MSEIHKLINHDFSQPHGGNYSRVMQDREEIIEYLDNSHVRILHNTEPYNCENHYHNCVEVIFMYENECNVQFPTTEISLNTGDILVIPPYMMHQITASKQVRQFIIMLDVELLLHFGIYASNPSSINDILLCNKDNCPQIYDSIRDNIIDIINAYFINDNYWQLEVYSHFLYVLAQIGKNAPTTTKANELIMGSNHKEHYDKFAELLQYVDLNLSEQITLDAVSSHVGFSKYHFIRLFKEYTGMTFYEYLTNKRVQLAKELLKSNMGITEIAFSCGFNNQTSFCRTFKKEVGFPPTEYRQQIKNS